jgi:hypothetical protein
MFKRALPLLVFTFLVVGTLWAAVDPFVGDWKLDPSKSSLTDEMTVRSVGGNKYLVDVGRGPEMTVVDGPDQSRADGSTVSVAADGPNVWKIVQKKEGRMLLTATWTLSQDERSLRDDLTAFAQDGSPSNITYVYKRTAGGGSGFAGTWVSTSAAVNLVLVIQIRPYEGNGLSISSQGSTKRLKFDGKDDRRPDEHTLELTDKKSDGNIADTREIKLSADRKTLTMTTHIPGRTYPQILVFERD